MFLPVDGSHLNAAHDITMNKLERIIVAEPSEDAALAVAEKLGGLSETVDVTHRGYDLLARVKDKPPAMK